MFKSLVALEGLAKDRRANVQSKAQRERRSSWLNLMTKTTMTMPNVNMRDSRQPCSPRQYILKASRLVSIA
jgi:hypothetical protein